MKLRKENCVVLLVVFCLAASGQLNMASGGGTYDAPMIGISIDGDLSDWNDSRHGVLSHSQTGNGSGGALNVNIKFAWDADNLYTLVQEASPADDDPVEGASASAWTSAPDSDAGAPWGTDSVGFYDGDRQLGPQVQWWIGLSSDDDIRHQHRLNPEGAGGDTLIVGQAANNVTGGLRSVEFKMPWSDIRYDSSDALATAGHSLQDVGVGYSFRNDPLLVDGVGDGSNYNGQSYPGGASAPTAVEAGDQSFVNLVVPEPSTIVLIALGIVGLVGCGLRRRIS